MIPLEKLAREALELADKATPGPWYVNYDITHHRRPAVMSDDTIVCWSHSADLIAHAGTHYKELAQAVLDLSEQNARLCYFIETIGCSIHQDCDCVSGSELASAYVATLKESHDKA